MNIGEVWEQYKFEHLDEYSLQQKLMNEMREKYIKDMSNSFYKGVKVGIEYVFTEILKNID